eukprot:snap_masked-scaffold_85-processed-gene-0.1-mRNA-1 protein AED:1.00 eAED:1.00 QI:0/0/0/0/1/1/4/0/129
MFPVEREVSSFFFQATWIQKSVFAVSSSSSKVGGNMLLFSMFHGNGAFRFPSFPCNPFRLLESFMDIIFAIALSILLTWRSNQIRFQLGISTVFFLFQIEFLFYLKMFCRAARVPPVGYSFQWLVLLLT